MNILLLLRTVSYLKLKQIVFQIRNRVVKFRLKKCRILNKPYISSLKISPIEKYNVLLDNGEFCFLNITDVFKNWNYKSHGMLWAYNLNYMDYLVQKGLSLREKKKWINLFCDGLDQNEISIGLDPYPIALRCINWIKFILLNKENLTEKEIEKWNKYLYPQVLLLEKKLEYHLMGNHLLEDAFSLFIASVYFNNTDLLRKTESLLIEQLNEQILEDGSHFEQSPMYHCIILDRLLDCYNFSNQYQIVSSKNKLKRFSERMLGYLESIIYKDKTIPLFNDSANGISPFPTQIFDYAKRLGLSWKKIPLGESGYRYLSNDIFESFIDIGEIKASYQPGHSHSDTFNYELRIYGKPFVVDTGISTYNKTEQRQYERSSFAHNSVIIGGKNSTEVWGGFRVARRPKIFVEVDSNDLVKAYHNGYRHILHTRSYNLTEDSFIITDELTHGCKGISLIHLSPDVRITGVDEKIVFTNIARIEFNNFISYRIKDSIINKEYNSCKNSKVIEIEFEGMLSYKIIPII